MRSLSFSKGGFYYIITPVHPEVTGSCLLVQVHYPNGQVTSFIVDCGMFQEAEYIQLNSQQLPFSSSKIKFALITHNHADHNGRLPVLVKEGFKGKIYCTNFTKKVMYHSLMDDYKIMMSNAKNKKQKVMYSETDIDEVMLRTEGCEYEETVYPDEKIRVTFLDNGHLPGAAMIFVQISYYGQQDLNILFTGDYKAKSLWREVAEIPEWIKELPKDVVTESTYGYMESSEIEYHYEEDIQQIIARRMSIVQFTYAQERAQVFLYIIKKLQDSNKISPYLHIYIDGNLAQFFTKVMQSYTDVDFMPKNVTFVDKYNRDEVISGNEQKIILTTSGMADHGPAQTYVPRLISRSDYVFYFPGYVSPSSLGYKIQHSEDGTIKIGKETYEIGVEIYSTGEFSSHAKSDELIALLRNLGIINTVMINHGQIESQYMLKDKIIAEKIGKRVEVLSGHTITIGHWGILKMMGAKLYKVKEPKKEKSNERKCGLRNPHSKKKRTVYSVKRH